MIAARHCSKPGCNRPAVATLTYDYHDSTVVLGPLATSAEPHAYDMCEEHANHLTAPQGWQVVRLQTQFEPAPPSPDDLMALADAVREAAHRNVTPAATRRGAPDQSSPLDPASAYARRRSHFHVVSGEGAGGADQPATTEGLPAGGDEVHGGGRAAQDADRTRARSQVAPSQADTRPELGPFAPRT